MKRILSHVVFVMCAFSLVPVTPVTAQDPNPGLASRVATLEDQVSILTQQIQAQGNRIAALEAALRRAFQPQSVFVDCAAGQSVNAALAQTVGRSAPLDIRVAGTCIEAVEIRRDDVTLRGVNPGDGIQAPSQEVSALALNGQRLGVTHVTIRGGLGLTVGGGGAATAENVLVTDARTGLNVTVNSHLRVRTSVIENGELGALVGRDSFLWASDTTFRNNARGFEVADGAVQFVRGILEGNNAGTGISARGGSQVSLGDVTIRNHSFGVVLQSATLAARASVMANNTIGALSMSNGSTASLDGGTIVEDNNAGVYVVGGSSIALGEVTIRRNQRFGIRLADVSVVAGGAGSTITANSGWGVLCAPAPAVPQISEGVPDGGFSLTATNVFGNIAGQINCPGIFVP